MVQVLFLVENGKPSTDFLNAFFLIAQTRSPTLAQESQEITKNKKNSISETKTDKNGYFLLLAPKTVTKYGVNGCKAYLVKSPEAKCSKVSKLNRGDIGSVLKPVSKPGRSSVIINKLTYGLFNVGPFTFDPVCPK
ncbi:unnamed protein product [Arabis nemorensis]|uniref:Uncharacterized protein n=1 Tax=Arabis nemorensis TaxID=586526 RepID=A0A565BK64_9BRAS|nr:unnamed protein product [Arabis nemorensis]